MRRFPSCSSAWIGACRRRRTTTWAASFAICAGKGVLIVGSGNIVHNLRRINWDGGAFDWALDFDDTMRRLILAGDHAAIIDYPKLGEAARLAIPTNEHFLPLLYILALQEKDEEVRFFAEKVSMGSLSMRSLQIG